jgi:hypothetical protein
VENAAIDDLVGQVLRSLARRDPVGPAALTLLLRRYASGADQVGDPLGLALASALDGASALEGTLERSAWLSLFAEAAAISADDRLPAAAVALVSQLRGEWPSQGAVGTALRSVDACLNAALALPAWLDPHALVPAAIDELERVVHVAYRPGAGLAHALGEPDGARGTLGEHVAGASALLAAYAITGRLPYSMLAEELIQFARHAHLDPGVSSLERFVVRAEAARVLCRLAKLHEDAGYRQVAVVAVSADYAADALAALADLAGSYAGYGADAAILGIALGEAAGLKAA